VYAKLREATSTPQRARRFRTGRAFNNDAPLSDFIVIGLPKLAKIFDKKEVTSAADSERQALVIIKPEK
jgi:hypothetical protein